MKGNVITYIMEKLVPRHKPNEHEQLVIEIIELLFNSRDTECIMSPISGRYYITNKRLNYWVKVADTYVTITNHKFTYVSQSPLSFNDYLINLIREFIERDREEFEKTVFQNELELLGNIKSDIQTKKK